MEKKKVLAIDFNNMVFMGFYKKPQINSKGDNINAIISFFYRLRNLIDMFQPDYIVFASDLSRVKTFRRKMYPLYKANRGETNPDLIKQMKVVSQIIALLGFNIINNELFEADDILGMISRLSEDNNMECIIASSDKDLYQLVTDNTKIYSAPKDLLVDKEYMKNEFGLTPDQWVDLKILQGDRGDNIPGFNGIGHTTALKLMNEFGSIENIFNNIDKVQEKLRDILKQNESIVPLTRKLVTIITDYSILKLNEQSLYRMEPYENEVFEVLEVNELRAIRKLIYYNFLV